ncbi:M64 family metallopeptidase [Kibdelosporangium philippinense]|uniref:M64 family metallopeptidase n=1 Tax=Kibdelosporangium philippinense TaxID=211113 RepID=A0ABS8Z805_9PSEU|nr:M64 family metallopeptidase [Kibdelosporangium philippinense]MCE7002703.1 M64 family metallopeptidase [Kibdelosporangium philippinense]
MWRRALVTAGVVVIPFLVALPAPANAEAATVVPVRITGDPAKRFNIVIVGDGYTAAEMPKFREHVDRHVNVLLTLEPFKTYRSYLNVYSVEVPSAESGVSCDPDLTSPRRNTPLGMGFWGGCNAASVQRLLTVNNAALTQYANLVTGTNSGNRQLLAIGNSNTYGGAGGVYATASGGNALSALITPHELGHSLGDLDDEYDYYSRGVRGDRYTGAEPPSIHHSLLTPQQMRAQRTKWWRWLGEPSESGGTIDRYEGGLYSGTGVWRPSKHSMMKSLGYYFDQISRERMTQRISGKTSILQGGTPNTAPIGADRAVFVETLHPVGHPLNVTWRLDNRDLPTNGARSVDLRQVRMSPGKHTLTATVVDPTPFVRDPAIRTALTKTRTWTVDTTIKTPPDTTPLVFTSSTPTDRPVSNEDVVYVETSKPAEVSWAVDGRRVPTPGNDRDFELKRLPLKGSHTLTASIPGKTLTWKVDATDPAAKFELSKPVSTVNRPGQPPEYVFDGPFTMKLTSTDDTPGAGIMEFRVNGDGWYNYFGWPTDANAPFLFTAEGTNIDNLVYGKLGTPRLSPWDDVPPGYGRHTIEYRAVDPAGNIGEAGKFIVTLNRP